MDRNLAGDYPCGGLRLTMGLAVCVWSLYQIKEHSGNRDLQKVGEDGTMAFVRKWKVGLTEGGDPEPGNGDRGDEGSETEDGVVLLHGFRDENGIPPGGFELVDWTPYEFLEHKLTQSSD